MKKIKKRYKRLIKQRCWQIAKLCKENEKIPQQN